MLASGDAAGALVVAQAAIDTHPESAEVHYVAGMAALALGRAEEAADALQIALHFRPDDAHAHLQLGLACSALGRPADALACVQRAVELAPESAEVWRGLVRQHLGKFDQALEDYERAIGLQPELHEARLNRGLTRLLSEDFARGWEDYEARKAGAGARLAQRYPFPQWDGGDLSGRTILIYGEQGLGDEIMFASCLPDIVARAGRVVLHCAPRLAPPMQRSFPGVCVHAGEQSNPDIAWLDGVPTPHVVTGIGSLPRYLRRQPGEFPRHAGYLRADPEGVARWRSRRAPERQGHHRRVLARRHPFDTGPRTVPGTDGTPSPAAVARCAMRQPAVRRRCRGACWSAVRHAIELPHFPEAIENYDETAALLCALGGVVSICTAAIHLGGALGRPVRVLVPSVPEWRYLRPGSNLPWYPSIESLRQPAREDWGPVIAEAVRRADWLLSPSDCPCWRRLRVEVRTMPRQAAPMCDPTLRVR